MKDAGPVFEEPWPDDETQLIIDAVRSAVTATSGAGAGALAEAGRRWARAHQSASLMRARLGALEGSMDAELSTASEADRIAAYRAWRAVTDAATWTSLTQLEEAALIDPLTGVGNRRALDLTLTRAMSGARRAGSELVVAAVDLDGLKRINDSQGHAEGDRTLTSLVSAFGEKLRASDTVFRTGGDEFAIVLPGMGLGDVDPLMGRISTGGTPGFTWGAAALAAEHQHPAELLDAADTDLYRRRGVEREAAGGGAGVGAVVGLRHPNGSIKNRASRRAGVAVAAGLVAIAGTLTAVTPLSPANHAALPLKHPSRPSGHSGPPAVSPPTTLPVTSAGPPATATTPVAPTTTPATSGASSSGIQLAAVTTPSPGAGSVGATTTGPSASTVSAAAPPTPAPAAPAPASPAPTATIPVAVATAQSNGNPTKDLPAQAAAAQAAHEPKEHVVGETATNQGTTAAYAHSGPATEEDRGRQTGSVRRDH